VPKISVVINTRNEEQNLPRALKSVEKLADEIIVVDMESTDKTVSIAKKAGAKVFTHKHTGIVEPARDFAIKKATGDWILILDADEEVSFSLVKKLKDITKDESSADYYRLPRKNIIFGKWIQNSRWWPDYIIRFFKNGKVSWSEIIHSVPTTEGRGIDLEMKEELAIVHHNYDSVEQYILRMNTYTTKQADLLQESGYKFNWVDLWTKPMNEFFSRYFFGSGYKDGVHGLALSLLQMLSDVVVYLKVWQHQKFKEQEIKLQDIVSVMKDSEKDLHYWQADALVKMHGGIKNRIKRKFKLS
jgi:(heptosyl)LPS beta-1,4-glucosyltransferase